MTTTDKDQFTQAIDNLATIAQQLRANFKYFVGGESALKMADLIDGEIEQLKDAKQTVYLLKVNYEFEGHEDLDIFARVEDAQKSASERAGRVLKDWKRREFSGLHADSQRWRHEVPKDAKVSGDWFTIEEARVR